MPVTTIQVRTTYTPEQEVAIIEAVQAALVEGLKIPLQDRHVMLVVHAPHRFIVPSALEKPERFTAISVDAFPGRSVQAKRALYQAMVVHLEPLGIPRNHVLITLRDIPSTDWGLRGGQAACDVDLGFDVNV
jgi:phenylpyruvate tautomerase PptA (4-oxalocrotonate tautomerase family)